MRTKLWHSLTLVLLLATGFACVWAMLVGFGMATFATNSFQMRYFEEIKVDANGETWITRTHHDHRGVSSGNDFNRTLEGEPLEVSNDRLTIFPGSLLVAENTKDSSPPWNRRVRRLVETHKKELWFVVHDGEEASGRMYLAGYDLRSKLLVGYLGKNGFQIEMPTSEQSFAVDGRAVVYGNAGGVALDSSSHMITTYGPAGATFQSRRGMDEPTIVNVASAGGLMKVNLRDRMVDDLDESGAYLSVAYCAVIGRAIVAEAVPEGVELSEIKPYGEDPEFDRYYKKKSLSAVVGRQQDRVVVFHPVKKQRHTFTIPTELRSSNFNFYFVSPELAVLNVSNFTREGWSNELFWINAQGAVQKSKQVWLNKNSEESPRLAFAVAAIIAPIPLLIAGGLLRSPYENPYSFAMTNGASYSDVLAQVLTDAWPMLVAVVLLSAVLAWLARRWHLKYARSRTAMWCGMVFFLGVPGLMGYWLYFARSPLEKCPECGRQAPRNRDACAHCSQPFAEPALLGTEILA